jgi:hypothetical protein
MRRSMGMAGVPSTSHTTGPFDVVGPAQNEKAWGESPRAFPVHLDPLDYIVALMTPQAIRAPEPPAGSVM